MAEINIEESGVSEYLQKAMQKIINIGDNNNTFVRFSNEYVDIKKNLKNSEYKIISAIAASKIAGEDEATYRIYPRDLRNKLDGDHTGLYSKARDIFNELMKGKFECTGSDGNLYLIPFLYKVIANIKKSSVDVIIHPFIHELIIGMKNKEKTIEITDGFYTGFDNKITNKFTSRYSQEIYLWLKSYNNLRKKTGRNPVIKITVDELREKLNCVDKYPVFSMFRKNTIEVAEAELKEKADIYFEFDLLRSGNRIEKIMFTVYENRKFKRKRAKKISRAKTVKDPNVKVTDKLIELWEEEFGEIKADDRQSFIKAAAMMIQYIEDNYNKLKMGSGTLDHPANFCKWVIDYLKDNVDRKKVHPGYLTKGFLWKENLSGYLKDKGYL